MKVEDTIRYSKFKTIRGNRRLNKKYLNELIESIQEHNMLKENPIMVNERMEVLDGQHRLAAAEILEIPVYYTVVSKGSLKEVQLLNIHQRRWTTDNFLDSYVERGMKEYIFVKEFIEHNGVSIATAIWLLSAPGTKRDIVNQFRLGDFKAVQREFAQNTVDRLHEVSRYSIDNAHKDRDFIRALVKVYQSGIKHEELMRKFEESGKTISRHASTRDYIRAFEDVLNYKRKTPLRLGMK